MVESGQLLRVVAHKRSLITKIPIFRFITMSKSEKGNHPFFSRPRSGSDFALHRSNLLGSNIFLSHDCLFQAYLLGLIIDLIHWLVNADTDYSASSSAKGTAWTHKDAPTPTAAANIASGPREVLPAWGRSTGAA